MKRTVTTARAFLSDIEVGDVVKNKSRSLEVHKISSTGSPDRPRIMLWSGGCPAFEGRPFDVMTCYIVKERKDKDGETQG